MGNYRLVSCTSDVGKLLERVFADLSAFGEPRTVGDSQYDCLWEIMSDKFGLVFEMMTKRIDEDVCGRYCLHGFRHGKPLIWSHVVDWFTMESKERANWLQNWLHGWQQSGCGGLLLVWWSFTGGVLQGSVLSPIRFGIYFSHLEDTVGGRISKLADNPNISDVVDCYDVCPGSQQYLSRSVGKMDNE